MPTDHSLVSFGPAVPRSCRYSGAGSWGAASCTDGNRGTLNVAGSACASAPNPAGDNWLAVRLPAGTRIGTIAIFSRVDQPNLQAWMGSLQVWLGSSAGQVASPAVQCGVGVTYSALTHGQTDPYLLSCGGASSGDFLTIRQISCPSTGVGRRLQSGKGAGLETTDCST